MDQSVATTVVQLIAATGYYGAEKVVAQICSQLSRISLHVVCLTRKAASVTSFQQVIKVSTPAQFHLVQSVVSALRQLYILSRTSSSLILHAHGYKEVCIACLFSLFFPCRLIVTQHGFTNRNRKLRFYNFLNKLCCRFGKVERVLCVSRAIVSAYEQFGVAAARLHYQPNGVLLTAAFTGGQRETTRKKIRSYLKLPETTQLILFAGRLSAEKDPLLFLKTFELLAQQHQLVHAVIAGTGPLKEELQLYLEKMANKDRVHFLGYVTEIEELLAAVDLLLLTSTTEGLPLIILEAFSVGTPVVAAAVGDVPEIISNGQNGMLVYSRKVSEFANCCMKFLSDRQLMEKAATLCRQTVADHFNLEAQRQFYLSLYCPQA